MSMSPGTSQLEDRSMTLPGALAGMRSTMSVILPSSISSTLPSSTTPFSTSTMCPALMAVVSAHNAGLRSSAAAIQPIRFVLLMSCYLVLVLSFTGGNLYASRMSAGAQETSQARALYERGVDAQQGGRTHDAIALLEQ